MPLGPEAKLPSAAVTSVFKDSATAASEATSGAGRHVTTGSHVGGSVLPRP